MTYCISLRKISPLKYPIIFARKIAQRISFTHNEREQERKKKGERIERGRGRERRTGEGEERRDPGVLLYICSP